MVSLRDRYVGCLLAGAVGDAAGVPYDGTFPGDDPHDEPRPSPLQTKVTDATQQLLFTAEGLLRAHARRHADGRTDWLHADAVSSVYHGLQRWLDTQTLDQPHPRGDGWLVGEHMLYQRNGRNTTTVRALRSKLRGSIGAPINNSQEPTVLTRMAPVAMVSWTPFPLGHDIAALTHNHPEACLAAGATATLLQKLLVGESLRDAVEATWRKSADAGGQHIANAIEFALKAADDGDPTPERCLEILGEPTASSALAVAVFATASTASPIDAIQTIVRAGGPASRLGALTGQISGALHGTALPEEWLQALEVRAIVTAVANDLYRHFSGVPFELTEDEWERYPG